METDTWAEMTIDIACYIVSTMGNSTTMKGQLWLRWLPRLAGWMFISLQLQVWIRTITNRQGHLQASEW